MLFRNFLCKFASDSRTKMTGNLRVLYTGTCISLPRAYAGNVVLFLLDLFSNSRPMLKRKFNHEKRIHAPFTSIPNTSNPRVCILHTHYRGISRDSYFIDFPDFRIGGWIKIAGSNRACQRIWKYCVEVTRYLLQSRNKPFNISG